MAQILPTYPGIGEQLGTGLSAGLQALAKQKMQDFQKQAEIKRRVGPISDLVNQLYGYGAQGQGQGNVSDYSPEQLDQISQSIALGDKGGLSNVINQPMQGQGQPLSKPESAMIATALASDNPSAAVGRVISNIEKGRDRKLAIEENKLKGEREAKDKLFKNFSTRMEKDIGEEFPEAKTTYKNMAHTLYQALADKKGINAGSVNFISNLMARVKPIIKKRKEGLELQDAPQPLVDFLLKELQDPRLVSSMLEAGGYTIGKPAKGWW